MWTPDVVKDLIMFTVKTLCGAYIIMAVLLAFLRAVLSNDD